MNIGPPSRQLVVVMGVSGSGKTVVGANLAEQMRVEFLDGDELHPISNVEKMRSGIALDDTDRQPWLTNVGDELRAAQLAGNGLVVACSALKRTYRDVIRGRVATAVFVLLDGDSRLVRARIDRRAGHFMPGSLLESQLSILERPGIDENHVTVDVALPVSSAVQMILAKLD